MMRQFRKPQKIDEVVERSRERTSKILDAVNAAIKATLDDLHDHGSLDDQFEDRDWHPPQKKKED